MELGSDKLKIMPTEEDEIEEQMSSDKFNCCRWWAKIDKKRYFWWKCGGREKSTVRDFLTPIYRKMTKKCFIGIYGKTAPTKSTVLGAGPPPGNFNKFIGFYEFFAFLGLQYSRKNRHQSRHLQPTPPRKCSKSGFFRKLSKIGGQ
jgi:hypothetical protein